MSPNCSDKRLKSDGGLKFDAFEGRKREILVESEETQLNVYLMNDAGYQQMRTNSTFLIFVNRIVRYSHSSNSLVDCLIHIACLSFPCLSPFGGCGCL